MRTTHSRRQLLRLLLPVGLAVVAGCNQPDGDRTVEVVESTAC
ncbi:hypothetical protein [Haloarcula laminariae]|nr:hypothetical protein [Halomicroarcula laminariae]